MIKETFNLIILDKSGSMSAIREAAIAGVNETVGTIRKAGRENDIAQQVTISAFCSCGIDDLCLNEPADNVKTITEKDYQPCCCTPLYDAIGTCCTRLKKLIANRDDVAVSVTIITDGYENASMEWTAGSIKKLIESLKAEGWLFAYIGANQDVEKVSFSMSIDNAMAFQATAEGTERMFKRDQKARSAWTSKLKQAACCRSVFNEDYFDN